MSRCLWLQETPSTCRLHLLSLFVQVTKFVQIMWFRGKRQRTLRLCNDNNNYFLKLMINYLSYFSKLCDVCFKVISFKKQNQDSLQIKSKPFMLAWSWPWLWPMTLMYKVKVYFRKMYLLTKNELSTSRILKVTLLHTYRKTHIYMASTICNCMHGYYFTLLPPDFLTTDIWLVFLIKPNTAGHYTYSLSPAPSLARSMLFCCSVKECTLSTSTTVYRVASGQAHQADL